MNILFVSTAERSGGGAIAARRLLTALNGIGINAKMLVRDKQTDLHHVIEIKKGALDIWRFAWERIVIWANNLFSKRNLFKVSIANTGYDITKFKEFQEADIIHLHWVNQGMISLRNIQQILESGKPVVWTMHDMWECTAICHHAYTCDRYKTECKNCPFLRFPCEHDLANRVFQKKKKLLANRTVHFITVSRWLERLAKESTLLKHCPIDTIPNTLSLSDFQMMDKAECRKQLGLPLNKKIIIFGAARVDDPIKGFPMILDALSYLQAHNHAVAKDLHLVTFGIFKQAKPHIPIDHTDIGWVKDNATLSILYSASDALISASLYETFGQTLIEAQACGCLPISFGNSGQTDIIRHKENGYLAEYLSPASLAEGIAWALTEGLAINKDVIRAEVVGKYSAEVVASRYLDLYTHLLESTPSS